MFSISDQFEFLSRSTEFPKFLRESLIRRCKGKRSLKRHLLCIKNSNPHSYVLGSSTSYLSSVHIILKILSSVFCISRYKGKTARITPLYIRNDKTENCQRFRIFVPPWRFQISLKMSFTILFGHSTVVVVDTYTMDETKTHKIVWLKLLFRGTEFDSYCDENDHGPQL